jgi:hypothetical protein
VRSFRRIWEKRTWPHVKASFHVKPRHAARRVAAARQKRGSEKDRALRLCERVQRV